MENLTIAFPVDEDVNSYIVKIKYVRGSNKELAYCIGKNGKNYTSDLPKNSGAYKLHKRLPKEYQNGYSFQFDPVRHGKSLNADIVPGESALRPDDINDIVAWRGTSDTLAWAMAIARAFSYQRKNNIPNSLLIAFSANIEFEPQSLGLFYPIIKPLCEDGSAKAICSLKRKWKATCDNNVQALLLHEEDAISLKTNLETENVPFVRLQKNTFLNLAKQPKPQIIYCKSNEIGILCESLQITKSFFIEENKIIVAKKSYDKLSYTRRIFVFLLCVTLSWFVGYISFAFLQTLPALPKKKNEQRLFLFEITKISNYRDELWRDEFEEDMKIISSFLSNPGKAQEVTRNLVRYKDLDFTKKVSPFPTPGISLKIPHLEPRLIQILLGNEDNNGWAFVKYCQSGQSPVPIIFRERKTETKNTPLPSELQKELDILDALTKGKVVANTKGNFRFYFLVIITKTIEGCSIKVRFFKSIDKMHEYINIENTQDEIFVPKMIEDLKIDVHTNCIKFRKIKYWSVLKKN